MTVSEAPVWTVESLISLASHNDEELRAWAVARLGRCPEPAGSAALVGALADRSPRVVLEAVHALRTRGDAAVLEAAHGPLRAVMRRTRGMQGPSLAARALLLEQRDPAAIDDTAARCLRNDAAGDPWLDLAQHAPDRFRLVASQLDQIAPTPEMLARAVIRVPRVARVEELPEAYANLAALSEPADRALLAWELLLRCQAEHLFSPTPQPPSYFEQRIDDQGAAYLYEEDEAHVQRWLSPAEFGPLLDAMQGERWAEAIAWCAWWCADAGGESGVSPWSRALLGLLTEEAHAEELHARMAACLAIAEGVRAIEREHPFAQCDLEEQFARACGGPRELDATRRAVITERWRELRANEDARADMADAFDTVCDTRGPTARRGALDIVAKLPGFPLTARCLELPEVDRGAYVSALIPCLAAHPDALRLLAPVAFEDPQHPATAALLAALATVPAPWVSELVRHRFDALVAGGYATPLLDAVRDLGDASLLAPVMSFWRPGDTRAASVASHLARLHGRESELPEALTRDVPPRPEPEVFTEPEVFIEPNASPEASVIVDLDAIEAPTVEAQPEAQPETEAQPEPQAQPEPEAQPEPDVLPVLAEPATVTAPEAPDVTTTAPREAPSAPGVAVYFDAPSEQPLSVVLVCNRCKRDERHQPGRAIVHPDLDACAREGWDGVTFERVVVCLFCGAEDDYTLGPNARLAIAMSALDARLRRHAGVSDAHARRVAGVATLHDGTRIRRASDALAHWMHKTASDPGDVEAWLRLGNLCKTLGRVDDAIVAFRKAIKLRPKHLDAPGALLHMLLVEGRATEGSDLAEVILKALPLSPLDGDVRAAFAELVTASLRIAGEAGQPLAFAASWPGATDDTTAVDLRRVTRWHRLAAFVAQPEVTAMGLKIAHPDDVDNALHALIEGDAPIAFAGEAPSTM